MGNSLQDQLLKAGLADPKQAKRPKGPKKKPKKGAQRGEQLSETAQAARAAQAAKAERDRQLNRQRKEEAERKALQAQVRQLVEQGRVAREEGELSYHFQHLGRIRSLHLDAALHAQLAAGRLRIVTLGGRYELVPRELAEKIGARDPDCLVPLPEAATEPDPDDPYAAYQVPDDLMW